MKKINFEIEEANIIQEDENSSFSTAKVLAFSSGRNRHRIECSSEVLKKTAPTIFNKPIVYTLDKNLSDFRGHSNSPDNPPLIAGFVVPNSAEFIENEDGRISLSVTAKLWKRYAPKVIEYFKRDPQKKKKASVEIDLYEYIQKKDGLIDMLDFSYQGICLIGDYITEASPGANAQILSFSKENEDYIEAFKQEFGEGGLTVYMPYKKREDMNPSLQGIDPPITPEQGEEIARQAEAIGTDEEKNGWAIAISLFKKRHHVENGRWVKNKENESMSVEKNNSNYEELDDDQGKYKKKENQETSKTDMSCRKDKQMDFELNFSVLLEEFDVESESYKLLFAESQKDNAERNYKIVYDLLLESLKNVKTELKKKNETISSIETEKASFAEEIATLKEFKTKIETQQKEFVVDSTLKESEEYIPKDELDQLKEDSANYTLENIEAWKNAVRAKAFTYTTKKEKGNDTIIKMGLPFGKETKKYDSLWN